MTLFTNISAYKFAPLDNLPGLREQLLTSATTGELKGTVLLSPEGINLFAAGTSDNIRRFVDVVRSIPGLHDLAAKESVSSKQPFGRMRVKIKRAIIAFGVPGIDPARRPSPKLAPRVLKQW